MNESTFRLFNSTFYKMSVPSFFSHFYITTRSIYIFVFSHKNVHFDLGFEDALRTLDETYTTKQQTQHRNMGECAL